MRVFDIQFVPGTLFLPFDEPPDPSGYVVAEIIGEERRGKVYRMYGWHKTYIAAVKSVFQEGALVV